MSTSTAPHSVSSILERARAKAAAVKQAGIGSIPSDPTQSSASIPPADPARPEMPAQSKPSNTDGAAVKPVPQPETAPAISGEGKTPSPADASNLPAVGPDGSVDTLLKQAKVKTQALLALVGANKQAAAPAPVVDPAAPAAAAPAAQPEKKAAAEASTVELTDAYHSKIASIILATEEGRQYVAETLERAIGRVDALELVKSASAMQEQFEHIGAEQLAWQEKVAAAEQQLLQEKQAFAKAFAALTPEQQAITVKISDNIKLAAAKLQTVPGGDILQEWLVKGAADAGAMMDQGGMGAPPPAAGDASGGQAGIEEIVAMIEQLVQSGEISMEEAQQIVQLLASEAGGDAGGEASPEMAETQKAASALATQLVPDYSEAELVKAASACQPAA